MPIKWRSKVLLAKVETTYGTDAIPTGAANAIYATDVKLSPMEGNDVNAAAAPEPARTRRGRLCLDQRHGAALEPAHCPGGDGGAPHRPGRHRVRRGAPARWPADRGAADRRGLGGGDWVAGPLPRPRCSIAGPGPHRGRTGAALWRNAGAGPGGRFEVTGIEDGLYDVRVRAVNRMGGRGDWLELPARGVTLLSWPPQDVTGFNIAIVGAIVGAIAHLSWDPVPDADLSHYVIRFSPATQGATFSDAVTRVTKVPRPATSVTVPAQTGTWFIRAIDKLGNASITPAAVTTQIAGVAGLNAVETVAESPGFPGSVVRFSQVPGLFGQAPGLFTGAGGVTRPTRLASGGLVLRDHARPGEGLYDFARVVDLGALFTSRVTVRLAVVRQDDTLGLFSQAAGLFTARTGLFAGAGVFSDIDAAVEISTSADMAAWTPWRRLSVGDFTARGLKFRLRLSTAAANVTPPM